MARSRQNRNNETQTTEESAVATEEAPVSTEATETPTESTESTDTPAADEKPIDLTEFNGVVEAALAEADTSTGEVAEADLTKVKEAYRALDGAKAKNAAKKAVNESMKDAMNSGAFPKARAYLMISEEALVAGGGGGGERTPTDPTEAFVQRVATLQLGYHLATQSVPEGVTDGWEAKVTELVQSSLESANSLMAWAKSTAEDKGDEPEAPAVVRNAVKLANGKAARAGSTRTGGTFTGERRDIGKHIESAFSDVEEGTFLSIAQIRAKESEEYGKNPPSAGAISARLFPTSGGKSSMEKVGIFPDTQDGKKGAVKREVPASE